jgi:hypothetical protein
MMRAARDEALIRLRGLGDALEYGITDLGAPRHEVVE